MDEKGNLIPRAPLAHCHLPPATCHTPNFLGKSLPSFTEPNWVFDPHRPGYEGGKRGIFFSFEKRSTRKMLKVHLIWRWICAFICFACYSVYGHGNMWWIRSCPTLKAGISQRPPTSALQIASNNKQLHFFQTKEYHSKWDIPNKLEFDPCRAESVLAGNKSHRAILYRFRFCWFQDQNINPPSKPQTQGSVPPWPCQVVTLNLDGSTSPTRGSLRAQDQVGDPVSRLRCHFKVMSSRRIDISELREQTWPQCLMTLWSWDKMISFCVKKGNECTG